MTDTQVMAALEPILLAIAASGKIEEMDRHHIRQALASHSPAAEPVANEVTHG